MSRRNAPSARRLLATLAAAALAAAHAGAAPPESPPAPADPAIAVVRKALETTAARPFSYVVDGRFKRTGAFQPPDVLTARITAYRSARRGDLLLVKGPEGLWKTPAEHVGEVVIGKPPPKDLADMIRVLETARPPQALIAERLDLAERGTEEAETTTNGAPCRTYLLPFRKEALRPIVEEQMEKEAARGDPRPETVRWETLRGHLRVYVDRRSGAIVRAVESRTVRIALKAKGEESTYRNQMAIDFAEHGTAALELPDEVAARLGMIKQEGP
jgi:hypothetical protein